MFQNCHISSYKYARYFSDVKYHRKISFYCGIDDHAMLQVAVIPDLNPNPGLNTVPLPIVRTLNIPLIIGLRHIYNKI